MSAGRKSSWYGADQPPPSHCIAARSSGSSHVTASSAPNVTACGRSRMAVHQARLSAWMPMPRAQPAAPSCAVGGANGMRPQAMTIPAAQPLRASARVVESEIPA